MTKPIVPIDWVLKLNFNDAQCDEYVSEISKRWNVDCVPIFYEFMEMGSSITEAYESLDKLSPEFDNDLVCDEIKMYEDRENNKMDVVEIEVNNDMDVDIIE